MGHDHGADLVRLGTRRRLLIAIVINIAIVIGEAIGGFITGSVALLADAGHNLTDVGALILALLASAFASMPARGRRSFGFYRLEILAALANGLVLVLVSVFVLVEAIERLRAPPDVPALPILFVALIALGGNVMSAAILLPGRDSLNIRAAFTHLVADALSSVGVIVAAILVLNGQPLADPVAGLFIAAVIVVSGYGIVREAIDVLLQAAPGHLDVERLKTAIAGLPDIRSVHDLHVWSLTSGVHVATLHVVVPREVLPRCNEIVERVTAKLHDEFAIEHTTVQVETEGLREMGHVHD